MTDFPNRHQLFEELINAPLRIWNCSLLYLTSESARQPGIHAQWCVRVMSRSDGPAGGFSPPQSRQRRRPCFLIRWTSVVQSGSHRAPQRLLHGEVMDELDSLRQRIAKYLQAAQPGCLARLKCASEEWQSIADVLEYRHPDQYARMASSGGACNDCATAGDQFRHQIASGMGFLTLMAVCTTK